MPNQNNFPLYFEELKIKEETAFTLSDLISQLKQQIPVNFVYLEIKEKNHQCSTTGWKEPVCERYGFEYQGDWKQIDIPHSLLAKLGLKKGVDLPSSFYLAPHLLKKEVETTQGGITLQEGEIIIVDPNKITIKDQAIQTEPREEEFKKLSEELETQQQNYLDLENQKNGEIAELRAKIQELETKLQQEYLTEQDQEFLKDVEEFLNINRSFFSFLTGGQPVINFDNLPQPLWNKIKQAHSSLRAKDKLIKIATILGWGMAEVEQKHQKLNIANAELVKEKGWWDKWEENDRWNPPLVYIL